MRIFNLDPLGFILGFHNADFVVGSAALALRQYADINLVGENTLDGFVCPFCGIAGLDVYKRQRSNSVCQSGL